jgi:hypothetical protein
MAYGREPELGVEDSITRMHQDMSDAVNVLMHSACADERLVQAKQAAQQQQEQMSRRSAAASDAAAAAATPQAPRADEVYATSKLGPAALDQAACAARGDLGVQRAQLLAGPPAPGVQRSPESPLDASPFQEEPAACFVLPDCTPVPLGPAGARWETFRREDSSALAAWLLEQAKLRAVVHPSERAGYLVHPPVCKLSDINHAIHNQAFFLTHEELKRLAAETGVHAWTFMQYDHEAVFIPAGCPHQVRNLRSCIKVALDFVSPEAAREIMVLSDEFSSIANEEKLQARLMLLHAAKHATELLDRYRQ